MSARQSPVDLAAAERAFSDRAVASHFHLVGALRLILEACEGQQGAASTLGVIEDHARSALEYVDRRRDQWIRDLIAVTHERVNA